MSEKLKPTIRLSIVECSACKSTGVRETSEVVNYHDYYEETWLEYCTSCDGEGRRVEKEYTYRVELDGLQKGAYNFETITRVEHEKLNGRTTADIYRIGRK